MRRFDVAAGILWNGTEVLIARRHAHDHQGGRWEFPGGKKHAGETIEACLRREFKEELDLEIEVGPLWRALSHRYPDRTVTLNFFFCRLVSGTPRPIEVSEFRWVRPPVLADLEFVEGDGPVLPDLIRDLLASPA